MPKKFPAYQWYIGDWRKEPTVQGASLATRGFWREAIDIMWEAPQRGKIRATIAQLSRMIGCSPEETVACLVEISDLKIGGVFWKRNEASQNINEKVTLSCRRMIREEKDRQANRIRQKRFRDKQRDNEDVTEEVTPYSSPSASSSASTKKKKKKKSDPKLPLLWESFWADYPKQAAKQEAIKAWNGRINDGGDPQDLVEPLRNYIASIKIKATEDEWIMNPATFIRGRWEEHKEPPSRRKSVNPNETDWEQVRIDAERHNERMRKLDEAKRAKGRG